MFAQSILQIGQWNLGNKRIKMILILLMIWKSGITLWSRGMNGLVILSSVKKILMIC